MKRDFNITSTVGPVSRTWDAATERKRPFWGAWESPPPSVAFDAIQ